jgi:hypothetical protein
MNFLYFNLLYFSVKFFLFSLLFGFDEDKFCEKDGDFLEKGTISIIILTDTFFNEGTIVSSIIQIQGVIQNLEN